jgi:hypothetical protein
MKPAEKLYRKEFENIFRNINTPAENGDMNEPLCEAYDRTAAMKNHRTKKGIR